MLFRISTLRSRYAIYVPSVRVLCICSTIFLLSACANLENKPRQTEQSAPIEQSVTSPDESNNTSRSYPIVRDTASNNGSQTTQKITYGSGKYIKNAKSSNTATLETSAEGDYVLNFQEVTIAEIAKIILGDILKLNYTISKDVTGEITIETNKNVSKEELLPLFAEILHLNGAALIEGDALYQIVSKGSKTRKRFSTSLPNNRNGANYQTYIHSLDYISAEEIKKVVEPIISADTIVNIDKRRNLVFLAGDPRDIELALNAIDVFDVNWLEGMSTAIVELKSVDPKLLLKELELALEGQGGKFFDGLVQLIIMDRLNGYLVISKKPHLIREMLSWINRLDISVPREGKQLFVYRALNSKASDLAQVLADIFRKDGSSSRSNTASIVPNANIARTETRNYESENEGADAPSSTNNQPNYTAESISISDSTSIRVISDDTHNSLLILSTKEDYQMVLAALKEIDIAPLQVLIEASIIQVELNDNLEYGVEWFFKNNFGSKTGQGLLDLGLGGIGPTAPGFSYTIVDSSDSVRAVINALSEESNVRVLSSPSLMVLDNHTATINIGDQIPVPARQSVSNINPDSPLVNEIDYRDTGVILTVSPRVNPGGLVTMEVRQEVSNAVNTISSNIDAPTIQQRQIESTVAIQSGDTIILGGLISENNTRANSGVPILHKLPVVGNLFGSTTDDNRRSELIVLITPRAAKNRLEAKRITEEYRRKLEFFKHEKIEGVDF